MFKNQLEKYKTKRNFKRTPEPEAKLGAKPGFRYLIQKHAARRLHYDLRLELDMVLKSWAVTKGPSLDPHDKRLAVEVEDHPVEYGSFEGIIPKGEYGGGAVMLWDAGTWQPIGEPHKGLEEGRLHFRLNGNRLKGEWALVRMKNRPEDKGRHNWLLIKRKDGYAIEGDNDELLESTGTSIKSGHTMEEIANQPQSIWGSKAANDNKPEILSPPEFIAPQLARLVEQPAEGDNWVHEIKFDGYRIIARIENGKVKLITRNGNDWTEKFHPIEQELKDFPAQNAILDGELVVVNKEGKSSFNDLQNVIKANRYANMQYYVFDLLFLDGKDLRKLPLLKRKEKLKKFFENRKETTRIFYSEHFEGIGNKLLNKMCNMHLEGVVSKRLDSPYVSGRGSTWVKSKCSKRQEFIIIGFTDSKDEMRGIGALHLATHEGGRLIYAGKVGSGFNYKSSADLRAELEEIRQSHPPVPLGHLESSIRKGAYWVKPLVVCEVEYTEVTPEGRLRHPVFLGLREDKPARDVEMEKPYRLQHKDKIEIAGIPITHPDRLLYSEDNITKLRVVEYYESIAPYILPYIGGRALSILRCTGDVGSCFFQKHMGLSPHVKQVHVKENEQPYVMVDDVEGLVSLAQMGMVELHPWGSRVNAPDKPDIIIFDLDPGDNVLWKDIVSAAYEIRTHLQDIGLESFVKISGGKGLHVTVPIKPEHSWADVKGFAKGLATVMASNSPKYYVANMSKAKRHGKIFIDYLRNDLGATAIAPYGLRAREGAPVALPLAWNELSDFKEVPFFDIFAVQDLVSKRSDPWKGYFEIKQSLSNNAIRTFAKYANFLKYILPDRQHYLSANNPHPSL